MRELSFVKDYRGIDAYRSSFFSLAHAVFGLDFEAWYRQGCWSERYIPYSYADDGRVVANVSVNLLELVIDGARRSAVQLGTVMTHPDYRGRGLSANLMRRVLEEYEPQCDFIYLFANHSVQHFYTKFGFRPVEERMFNADAPAKPSDTVLRKLDMTNENDLKFISTYASERVPVSRTFGTSDTHGIVMYYCMNVFPHHIYYLQEEDVIVLYERHDNHIDLYDVIGRTHYSIHNVLAAITEAPDERVIFHFTPDDQDLRLKPTGCDSLLFVKELSGASYPLHVKHPVTSIA